MAEHKAVTEKDEEKLNKDWCKDTQSPDKFRTHQPASFEMLEDFEGMWDGHQGRMNVSKHRINLLNDEVSPVHSASYSAGPTARKFVAAKIDRIIPEKYIEAVTTQWAASIAFAPKKNGSLRFCAD